jgi:hypothetical protein
MRVGKNAQLLLVPRMQLLRIVGFEEDAADAGRSFRLASLKGCAV